jgi:hypothetical protein
MTRFVMPLPLTAAHSQPDPARSGVTSDGRSKPPREGRLQRMVP